MLKTLGNYTAGLRRVLLLLLALIAMPAVAQDSGVSKISDMGHVALGMSVKDVSLVSGLKPQQFGSVQHWTLDTPQWGLSELKFRDGRVVEMTGINLNLAIIGRPIVKGMGLDALLKAGLPKLATWGKKAENGTLRWKLADQLFPVKMKDAWHIQKTTKGTQILSVQMKKGLVQRVTLSTPAPIK